MDKDAVMLHAKDIIQTAIALGKELNKFVDSEVLFIAAIAHVLEKQDTIINCLCDIETAIEKVPQRL